MKLLDYDLEKDWYLDDMYKKANETYAIACSEAYASLMEFPHETPIIYYNPKTHSYDWTFWDKESLTKNQWYVETIVPDMYGDLEGCTPDEARRVIYKYLIERGGEEGTIKFVKGFERSKIIL